MTYRIFYAILFFFYILFELVMSTFKVAKVTLSPRLKIRPGVIAVPIPGDTDVEIMLLANLITLTPGTLSLDVSSDKKVLYVHSIDIDHPDKLRTEIKANLERRIRKII